MAKRSFFPGQKILFMGVRKNRLTGQKMHVNFRSPSWALAWKESLRPSHQPPRSRDTIDGTTMVTGRRGWAQGRRRWRTAAAGAIVPPPLGQGQWKGYANWRGISLSWRDNTKRCSKHSTTKWNNLKGRTKVRLINGLLMKELNFYGRLGWHLVVGIKKVLLSFASPRQLNQARFSRIWIRIAKFSSTFLSQIKLTVIPEIAC